MDWLRDKPLKPLLKWPGGKSSELKLLRANNSDLFPTKIERYFEPFLGGGAIWLAVNTDCPKYVNDSCADLMSFYERIKSGDHAFFQFIEQMATVWEALHESAQEHWEHFYETGDINGYVNDDWRFPSIDIDYRQLLTRIFTRKVRRVKLVEAKSGKKLSVEGIQSNVEGALKAGYYTYIRDVFNRTVAGPLHDAAFYFLRDFCFSSMFRYSRSGEFNVPYGGVSYNKRSPSYRVKHWKSENLRQHLETTEFGVTDFEAFLDQYQPTRYDFAFIDPPYDTNFNTYDKKTFDLNEQVRLASYLIRSKMQFMAVMKYTTRIYDLYKDTAGIQCFTFDKNFAVSFRDRNDRRATLLTVTRINQ